MDLLFWANMKLCWKWLHRVLCKNSKRLWFGKDGRVDSLKQNQVQHWEFRGTNSISASRQAFQVCPYTCYVRCWGNENEVQHKDMNGNWDPSEYCACVVFKRWTTGLFIFLRDMPQTLGRTKTRSILIDDPNNRVAMQRCLQSFLVEIIINNSTYDILGRMEIPSAAEIKLNQQLLKISTYHFDSIRHFNQWPNVLQYAQVILFDSSCGWSANIPV